jgi:transcriptional regulator with XRE-family HTH domain
LQNLLRSLCSLRRTRFQRAPCKGVSVTENMLSNSNWRERFRDRLLNLGISQIEFAEILGISPQRLSNWLNSSREPSIEYLSSIIRELGVTADWFLFGVQNQRHIVSDKTNSRIVQAFTELTPVDREKIENAIEVLSLIKNEKEH